MIRSDHNTMGYILASGRQRWRLEDRLSLVFDRLRTKAAAAEAAYQERLRKQDERQRAWGAELDKARERWGERYRTDLLVEIVRRYQFVKNARDYLQAAHWRAGLSDGDREWLDWVERHVDAQDPVLVELPPPHKEPSESALLPFVDRSARALGLLR